MEVNPFRSAASLLGTQVFPKMLMNRRVNYRVHNSPQLASTLA
jgi:hypothetical protein